MSIALTQYPDGRLNTKAASAYLGLAPKTLAMMRSEGKGPRFIKRGRVFYYIDDLNQWLNENGRFKSTAEARLKNNQSGL